MFAVASRQCLFQPAELVGEKPIQPAEHWKLFASAEQNLQPRVKYRYTMREKTGKLAQNYVQVNERDVTCKAANT
jgi:hypothetical protein